MASRDGFSLNGVGSVVSVSGSRRLETISFSFFPFFPFLPFLSFSSSDSLSTRVCSPVDFTFRKSLFSSSPPADDQVPTDDIRLCRPGVLSPTFKVSLPLSAVGLLSLNANVDFWAAGEPGMRALFDASSEKWTDELLVNVGEGGTAPAYPPFPEGERWEAEARGGVE
jgi:hypothetical protein